jgi:hypothetical protein
VRKEQRRDHANRDIGFGGTRVVFKNADDAATIGRAYKDRIIRSPIVRTPTRTVHV